MEAAMAALLAMREAALAPGPVGAGVARSVTSIASALAQRDTEAICGSSSSGGAGGAANGGSPGLANGHAVAVRRGAPSTPTVLPLAELMKPPRIVLVALAVNSAGLALLLTAPPLTVPSTRASRVASS